MRRRAFLATSAGVGIAGCATRESFGIGSSDTDGNGDSSTDESTPESQQEPHPDHELIAFDPYLGVEWDAVTGHKSTGQAHPRNTFSTPAEVVDFYRGEQEGALGRTVADDEVYSVYAIADKGSSPMKFPWTEFSNIDSRLEDRDPAELGVVSFPGAECEVAEHVTSMFSLIVDDYVDAEDRHGVIKELLERAEFHEPKGLAVLTHPDRYIESPDDWTRYAEDLETFSRGDGFVGLDVFSRTDPVGESLRPMWDNMLSEYAPGRMIWGFGADDSADYRIPIDADVRWTTLLLDDEDFDPADQAASREAAMEASLEGRMFVSARRPQWDEEQQEAYPTPVPAINAIEIDDRGITLRADNYNEVRWISNGEVVTTGPSLVLTDQVAPYVRAELEAWRDGNHAITCTQPWGIGTSDDE